MPDLRELYEEYFPVVYNRIFFRLLNKADAEDIVSVIFLKIAGKLHTFDESKASLKTWIFAITNNALIDYYRTRKEPVSLDDDENTYEPSVDFEEQYRQIRGEDGKALYAALSELDRRSREILSLKYFEDLTVRQIAARMGINESTVSTIHLRALAKLKTLLGEKIRAIEL